MSKKKKKKKKTALPVNQQATTRSGGITTYYRKGKECHCASKRPAGSTEERDSSPCEAIGGGSDC